MKIIKNKRGGNTIIPEKGETLSMVGNKWYINGQEIDINSIAQKQQEGNTVTININIEGSLERLEVDYCEKITITGDCKRVKTNSGDISVGGDVAGDVHTNMGDVDCGNVEGDVHTNMGNIRYNK